MTDTNLNLDEQLTDHLCLPESALIIHHHQFGEHLVGEDHPQVKAILAYVMQYIDANGKAPTTEMIEYDNSVTADDPRCDLEWLINEMQARYRRNQLKGALRKASETAIKAPAETLQSLHGQLEQIRRETSSRSYEATTDDIGVAMQAYKDRVKNGVLQGPTFGFSEIDSALGGLQRLTFLAARPKQKKTMALVKSCVENTFSDSPKKCLFVTMEQTEREILDRFICMSAGIPFGRFMKGTLDSEHYRMIREVEEEIEALPDQAKPIFWHPPRNQGMRTVSAIRQKARIEGAEYVIGDQLSFVEPSRYMNADLKHLQVAQIAEDLYEASGDCPHYWAVQLNRGAANLKEIADIANLAESDYIGRVATMVCALYQSKEMRQSNVIQFGVIAARNAPIKHWNIRDEISKSTDFRMIGEIEEDM